MTTVLTETTQATSPARAGRLRGLHPGWFGAVMGTAILAVAVYRNPGEVGVLRPTAHVAGATLWVIAVVLGLVLAVPYVARWVRHRDAAVVDLRHPVLGPLYGTFPGGLLVLAVATSTIGGDLLPDTVATAVADGLTILGAVLAFTVAVAFGYVLFTGEVTVAEVNGGWFIPPVVTIIVPVAVVPLLTQVSSSTGRLLLAAGWAFFGMGLLLFVFIMGLLVHRLVTLPLPAPPLAPSLWIGLGPVGVGSLALTSLASTSTAAAAVQTVAQLAATGLWGFGLWWLALAVALLVRYLRAAPLPYGLGWWAFTFPLGAYTVATLALARLWQSGPIEAFATALFLTLAAVWIVVAVRTTRAIRTGQVWQR